MTTIDHSASEPPSCRALLIAAAFVASLVLGRHAFVLDTPWDLSLASINGTYYMAGMARTWERHGFRSLHGETCLLQLPSDPVFRSPYHHHPPLFPWLIYGAVRCLGWSEAAFRAVPVVFSAAAAFLLVLLVGRRASLRTAFLVGLLHAAAPMGFHFGWMPNPEPGVLFFILLVIATRARTPVMSLRHRILPFAGVFLGLLCDWQAGFVIPALLVGEALRPRSDRRWRSVFELAIPAAASIAVTFLFFAWWKGSFGAALDGFIDLVRGAGNAPPKYAAISEWWQAQVRFWRTGFSLPALLCAIAALPWLLFRALRHGDSTARLALVLLVPGIANAALFRSHAFDHDFWWYFALPYVALATVSLIESATRVRALTPLLMIVIFTAAAYRLVEIHGKSFHLAWLPYAFLVLAALWCRRSATSLLPVVLVLAVAFSSVVETLDTWHRERRVGDVRQAAEGFMGLFEAQFGTKPDERDLFVRLDRFGPESFYFPFYTASDLVQPARLELLAALHRGGRSGLRNVVLLCPNHILASHPELQAILPRLGTVRLYGEVLVVIVT